MLRSRSGAFLLVVVAVFWSALPLGACLLAGQTSAASECCSQMAQDCPMHGANMNASCCRTHSEDGAVVPEVPFALEHVRMTAMASQPVSGVILSVSTDAIRCVREAPPPDTPPGAGSILRI